MSKEEGVFKLREGEFENAKFIFSELLDKEPENPDLIVSFFISSYWDNRLDMINLQKEGKERGSKIVRMFDEFEEEIQHRRFPKNEAYRAITHCVLSEASYHFRLAFQKEGSSSMDKKVLNDLSICLLRIGDYKNAMEIIEYYENFANSTPETVYLRAECLYHLNQSRKSRVLFREALLYDPELLRIDIIQSEPLQMAIAELKEKFDNIQELKEYLPVHCLLKHYFPEIRNYSADDLHQFLHEMDRLEENLSNEKEQYRFKIRCRILQFGLTILDSYQCKLISGMEREVTSRLNRIEPGLLNPRVRKKESRPS